MGDLVVRQPHLGRDAIALLQRIVDSQDDGLVVDDVAPYLVVRLIRCGCIRRKDADASVFVATATGVARCRTETMTAQRREADAIRREIIRNNVRVFMDRMGIENPAMPAASHARAADAPLARPEDFAALGEGRLPVVWGGRAPPKRELPAPPVLRRGGSLPAAREGMLPAPGEAGQAAAPGAGMRAQREDRLPGERRGGLPVIREDDVPSIMLAELLDRPVDLSAPAPPELDAEEAEDDGDGDHAGNGWARAAVITAVALVILAAGDPVYRTITSAPEALMDGPVSKALTKIASSPAKGAAQQVASIESAPHFPGDTMRATTAAAPSPELHKPDAPRPDAPRPEAARSEAARPPAARPDVPRPEATMALAARSDVPKPDVLKPDIRKTDSSSPILANRDVRPASRLEMPEHKPVTAAKPTVASVNTTAAAASANPTPEPKPVGTAEASEPARPLTTTERPPTRATHAAEDVAQASALKPAATASQLPSVQPAAPLRGTAGGAAPVVVVPAADAKLQSAFPPREPEPAAFVPAPHGVPSLHTEPVTPAGKTPPAAEPAAPVQMASAAPAMAPPMAAADPITTEPAKHAARPADHAAMGRPVSTAAPAPSKASPRATAEDDEPIASLRRNERAAADDGLLDRVMTRLRTSDVSDHEVVEQLNTLSLRAASQGRAFRPRAIREPRASSAIGLRAWQNGG